MEKYTDEQIKDVQEREAKALEVLKELQLSPAAVVHKVNLGDDVFADKVQPYLRDIKYSKPEIVSPIQVEDIKPEKPDESPEKVA